MTPNNRLNEPEKKPVILGRYRVQKSNLSKYVFLPKPWWVINGIEAGDEIEFSMEKDGTLCARKVEEGGVS